MNLQDLTQEIDAKLNPYSTILYGSRARTDFLEDSDHEIGLLFKRDYFKDWSQVRSVVSHEGVNIYPFVFEDFLHGKIDTPFQKTIYKRELIVAGKTISGEKVIENMNLPKIKAVMLWRILDSKADMP